MMSRNESVKEKPLVDWTDTGYITTKNEVEAREKSYMMDLWEKEQQASYDPSVRFWNLHDLNRCRDPLVKPPTYSGYVPHIAPENLVGGTFGKTLKASHRCDVPDVKNHVMTPLSSKDSVRGLGSPRSAVRFPASNDATGRAPAHYGDDLANEMPWLLDKNESISASILLKGLANLPPGEDPLDRSRPPSCSNKQWREGQGMQTSWSLLDTQTRSASVYETPPSQRSALLPITFRLRTPPSSASRTLKPYSA